jgi:hypothetical protein
MANTFGTFSLSHFHHPWRFYIIFIHSAYTLFTSVHYSSRSLLFFIPDSSNAAGRFPQQEGRATMCFLSHRCHRGFAKIFFVPLSSTLRYYMIFIHPTIYFCTNSCISIDFTPCHVYLVDFQGRKEEHRSNVIEYSSIHSVPFFKN